MPIFVLENQSFCSYAARLSSDTDKSDSVYDQSLLAFEINSQASSAVST